MNKAFFHNKIIWITGASSGIGEALVYLLARQGAKIVLSARREPELIRVAQKAALNEADFLILPFDLNDTRKAREYAQLVIDKFKRIDILINNGGLSQRSESLETPEAIERQLMEINYFSAVNLAKSVLPQMIVQGGGQLVVISSISGKFGFYLRSTYSAAKHALHGYFEALRLETEKKGIKILMVCPGKIKTNISYSALTAEGKAHNKMDKSHQAAMSAEQCAEGILKAIVANKEEILVGGKELKAVWLKRFSPKIFAKIIRKQSPY